MDVEGIIILLIEDNPGDVRLIQEMLAEAKYTRFTLVCADRLSSGLERLTEGDVDVVLLDLGLPDSHGLDTLRRVVAEPPRVPAIAVLTGLDDEDLGVQAIEAGAQDYLVKGQVDSNLLVRALRYAVERKRAEDALRERLKELTCLFEVHRDLQERLPVDELCRRTVEHLIPAMQFPGITVPLIELDDHRFTSEGYTQKLSHGLQATIAVRGEIRGQLWVYYAEDRPFLLPEEQELVNSVAQALGLWLERRRAEEARRESEERYRTLVDNVPIGVYRSTPGSEGRFLMANPTLLSMFGFESEEELKGISVADLYMNPSERRVFSDNLLAQGSVIGVEYQFKKKDGTPIWGSVTARVVYDESGRAAYFDCTIEDITARKLLEAQLLQSQKMEAVGRLAGGVAHDFNNLLTAIIGYSDLVLMKLEQDDPMRKDVGEIKSASDRAALLTNQLLAFSRKQVLQPRVLDLNSTVADVEKMLHRLIGEDIELITILAPDLGQVKADPGQIDQVLMNLAVNARDAMPQGGKLTIETGNVYLDEDYAQQHVDVQSGSYVMLAVSDTGVGMDQETQSHLFEPFFTTKEMGKGTGLGLATVYGIVKQSDGHIWVYSEVGQGTTFKIYLPRIEEAVEPSQRAEISVASLRGWETVLLVEDNDDVRELARRVLSQSGYTVLEARDGEEALRVCERHEGPIHLLVSDVVMPGGMSGRDLAESLATMQPEMKVLYMSGYTDNAIIHHGVLEPGMIFLQKPFTPAILAHRVRETLDAP